MTRSVNAARSPSCFPPAPRQFLYAPDEDFARLHVRWLVGLQQDLPAKFVKFWFIPQPGKFEQLAGILRVCRPSTT